LFNVFDASRARGTPRRAKANPADYPQPIYRAM
jgi:hypothetical protein